MNDLEALAKRHTVRKYKDIGLSKADVDALQKRISNLNESLRLNMHLVLNDTKAINPLIKMILSKGVSNYIVLEGQESHDLDERLGYAGADLMMLAQKLGMNTWWVGGTFNRKKLNEKAAANNKVIGIIAVGYGLTPGVPHKSKIASEVSSYEGSSQIPEWFKNGVDTALLAPTALNKQAFHISGRGNKVSVSCDNGIFSGADKGIVKYHFEKGAGQDNFRWANSIEI